MTATTLSSVMRRVTAVPASCGLALVVVDLDRRSSCPSTPPAALISSTASMMPLCVDWPKVASEPVIEPYSPMRIVSLAGAGALGAFAVPRRRRRRRAGLIAALVPAPHLVAAGHHAEGEDGDRPRKKCARSHGFLRYPSAPALSRCGVLSGRASGRPPPPRPRQFGAPRLAAGPVTCTPAPPLRRKGRCGSASCSTSAAAATSRSTTAPIAGSSAPRRELGVETRYIEPGDGSRPRERAPPARRRAASISSSASASSSPTTSCAAAARFPGVQLRLHRLRVARRGTAVVPPPNLVGAHVPRGGGLVPRRRAGGAGVQDARASASSAAWTSRSSTSSRPATAPASPSVCPDVRGARRLRRRPAQGVREPGEGQGAGARAVRPRAPTSSSTPPARPGSACSRRRGDAASSRSASTPTSSTRRPAASSTSMVKRVDVAVFETIRRVPTGKFAGRRARARARRGRRRLRLRRAQPRADRRRRCTRASRRCAGEIIAGKIVVPSSSDRAGATGSRGCIASAFGARRRQPRRVARRSRAARSTRSSARTAPASRR